MAIAYTHTRAVNPGCLYKSRASLESPGLPYLTQSPNPRLRPRSNPLFYVLPLELKSVYTAGPSRHYPVLHGEGKFFYLAVQTQTLSQSWVSLQHIETDHSCHSCHGGVIICVLCLCISSFKIFYFILFYFIFIFKAGEGSMFGVCCLLVFVTFWVCFYYLVWYL